MNKPTLEDLRADMTEAIAELKAAAEAVSDGTADGVRLQEAVASTTVSTAYAVLEVIEHLQGSAGD